MDTNDDTSDLMEFLPQSEVPTTNDVLPVHVSSGSQMDVSQFGDQPVTKLDAGNVVISDQALNEQPTNVLEADSNPATPQRHVQPTRIFRIPQGSSLLQGSVAGAPGGQKLNVVKLPPGHPLPANLLRGGSVYKQGSVVTSSGAGTVKVITLPPSSGTVRVAGSGGAVKTVRLAGTGGQVGTPIPSSPGGPTVIRLPGQAPSVQPGRIIAIRGPPVSNQPSNSNVRQAVPIMHTTQGPVVLRPGIQVIRTVGPNMGPLPGGSHAITRRVDGSLSTARQFMLHQKQQFLQDQALVNRDRNRSIPGSVGDFFDRPGSPGSGYDDDDDSLGGLTGGYKSSGLRKYSKSVCQKVKEKGITSYNEVADELVQEYAAEHPMIPQDQLHYHQKNIRRRVYDALNVLMAMNIITKEKKEIRWVGLPVNSLQECRRLEQEREQRLDKIRAKVGEIQEAILQLIAFKNLVARNRVQEKVYNTPMKSQTIPLPYLIVLTNKKTVIDCNITNDKMEYLFTFDQSFEIRDDMEVMKKMGLTQHLGTDLCSEEEYSQCLELIPPSLRFYVEAMYERRPPIVPDFEAVRQRHKHFLQSKLERAASRMPSMNTGGGMSSSSGHTTIFRSPGPSMVHSHHNSLLRNMSSSGVASYGSLGGSNRQLASYRRSMNISSGIEMDSESDELEDEEDTNSDVDVG